jgi:3-deoxy-D-manno-octulosonic-acid transferase/heptosyltransferase-1
VLISRRKSWVHRLRGPGRWEALADACQFLNDLRDTYYDIVIDFHSLLKSGVLVGLARGQRKIGFDRGMQHQEHSYLFYNERVPPVDMEIHALTRGLMLLNAIGIQSDTVAYDLPVSDGDRQRVEALLKASGIDGTRPLVAINPVALWETKLWVNERFAQLAERLVDDFRADVVFTGGPADRSTVAAIRQRMAVPSADLSGRTTLKMLAAFYQRSALLVTTDTGPMHLAAAVDTPVVALFGPTAPWRTGPFGGDHQVVHAVDQALRHANR